MKHHYLIAFMFATTMIVTISPARASDADDRIKETFKNTYVYKTYLKDDKVEVDSEDGVVTLSGTVAEESHKALAEDTVANISGVIRVENKLATTAEAAADDADTWIGRKVKMALLYHRNVSSTNTTVSVADGVVTLRGEAANQAQKDLTAEYAKDIDGVKSVTNVMTVAAAEPEAKQTAGEKIDDASVTAQVKMALLTHRSTSAISTTVATMDGKVTITGIAKNEAEKSLVTKVTKDIQGVSSVDNRMTVK